MDNKLRKTNPKETKNAKSIRISFANLAEAKKLLALANKKKRGRTVKFDQMLSIALSLLTEEHITSFQEQSLSNADRKEILRQKWIELHGPISEDEFTGFTFTPQFQVFLGEHVITSHRDTQSAKSTAPNQ